MKNRLGLLAILCALLINFALPAADDAAAATEKAAEKADPVWLTSFEKARATAKAEKKIILANFTGSDWCPWCVKLEQEVFATEAFKTWAAQHVILLKVDFPRKKQLDDATKNANRALADKYEIERFPTVLFIDVEGKNLGQTGYLKGGAGSWIKNSENLVSALNETSAAPAAANKSGDAMAATVTTTGAGQANATVAATNAQPVTGACSATAATKTESCSDKDAAACSAKDAAACEVKVAKASCCPSGE